MKKQLAMTLCIALLGASLYAGENHKRKENQQKRVDQGVATGQLTPKETARIEKQEAAISREQTRMKAKNGGQLTLKEQVKIDKQQNHLSREIKQQKHDKQHN